ALLLILHAGRLVIPGLPRALVGQFDSQTGPFKPVTHRTVSDSLFPRFSVSLQTIANARFGEQITRPRGIPLQLVAKLAHVDAQVMALVSEARAPDLFQELAMGEDLARVLDEDREEVVLRACDVHLILADEHAAGAEIDLQLSAVEYRFALADGRPCRVVQGHAHPGQQLPGAERLGQVV